MSSQYVELTVRVACEVSDEYDPDELYIELGLDKYNHPKRPILNICHGGKVLNEAMEFETVMGERLDTHET